MRKSTVQTRRNFMHPVTTHHLWRTVLGATMLFPPLDNAMAQCALVVAIEWMILSCAAKIMKPKLK